MTMAGCPRSCARSHRPGARRPCPEPAAGIWRRACLVGHTAAKYGKGRRLALRVLVDITMVVDAKRSRAIRGILAAMSRTWVDAFTTDEIRELREVSNLR